MDNEKRDGLKLSVIMPIYNSEKYLARAVESVLNQDFDGFELILVDDGSTDRSAEICDALQEKDYRIRVIHKKNGGVCSARNAGLKAAVGEYVAFCDNDDKYLSGLLKDNYRLAKEYDADIVRYNWKCVYYGKNRSSKSFSIPKGVHCFRNEEIDENYMFINKCSRAVWSALYRRSFLTEHSLQFYERAKSGLEDAIFNTLANKYCNCIVINSRIYYEWSRREVHSTSDKFNENIIPTLFYSIKIESEVFHDRNKNKGNKQFKDWDDVVLYYVKFCFWSMNKKACRYGLQRKLLIMRKLRENPYLVKEQHAINWKKSKKYDELSNRILYNFYQRNYFFLYMLLKIQDPKY